MEAIKQEKGRLRRQWKRSGRKKVKGIVSMLSLRQIYIYSAIHALQRLKKAPYIWISLVTSFDYSYMITHTSVSDVQHSNYPLNQFMIFVCLNYTVSNGLTLSHPLPPPPHPHPAAFFSFLS